MKYLKKELDQGTEPDKIAYISFTKTAFHGHKRVWHQYKDTVIEW